MTKLLAALALIVVLIAGALAYRATRPPPPPPAPWVISTVEPSASPLPVTEEEQAIAALSKLARPTVDLEVWSRDPQAREADCLLVLGPLARGQSVTVRPGAGCELIAVNGGPVEPGTAKLASPPLVAGLNWLRVRTSLPRKILGSIDVPPDPPYRREARSRATPEELELYERARHAIYPPGKLGGQDEARSRAELDQLPDRPGPVSRRFFHVWLDLAATLTRAGHGTPVANMGNELGGGVWDDPAVLAKSRAYMDAVQQSMAHYPDRWFLWLGLAWQLRWGNAWDGARTAFVQALHIDPTCGWSWFELARWERRMEMDGAGRDPRTRLALARDALQHYRLARKHLAGRTSPGLREILAHIDGAIDVMQRLVRKAAR